MNLNDLLQVAQSDPEDGKYRLVLYKQDGLFWVRRGEADVPSADHQPCLNTLAGCAPDCHAGNRCTS